MTTFSPSDDLAGARFVGADLRGARFVRSDLRGAVMRGVDLDGADIDAPWLLEAGGSLVVNGVDVAPLIDAELDRRFPGRGERRATDPDGLRAAWAAVERAWTSTLARVDQMRASAAASSADLVDVEVDGEWSFAETLRHLVMATDTWLGRAVLGREQPYHPLGMPNAEYASDGYDTSVFAAGTPAYADVLDARADRVAMVREFLATVDADALDEKRPNPWAPDHLETVRSCLHTILEEEWAHLRYAVRDLDALDAPDAPDSGA